jgi:alkanesulfonate monooxygenase SsuD/methylene tetrahydromethanopterin reductase-like flavin-dependent oxidoreductase (luciferase family)
MAGMLASLTAKRPGCEQANPVTSFRPTTAPRGRLVRLGVVLDTRNAPNRLREVARMCDGAGIEALWVRDQLAAPDGQPRLEAWTAVTLVGMAASRPRIGATLNVAFRPPATLAAMAGTLDAAIGGRLELGLSAGWIERENLAFGFDFPDPEVRARRLERYAAILRGLLAGDAVSVGGSEQATPAELGVASPQQGGPPLSVEGISPHQMDVAVAVADDVVIPSAAVRDLMEAVSQVRRACERGERDPSTLGIALDVPVSIGRTVAEAQARAESEPLFEVLGPPSEVGIFGTLEQCQERVIELAHGGVTDLRCTLPNSPDVHDVIAQLTAMVVGTVDVLSPGAPKSKSPDPPSTWGGRSPRRAGSEEGSS